MVVILNLVRLHRPLRRSNCDRLDALPTVGWLEVAIGVGKGRSLALTDVVALQHKEALVAVLGHLVGFVVFKIFVGGHRFRLDQGLLPNHPNCFLMMGCLLLLAPLLIDRFATLVAEEDQQVVVHVIAPATLAQILCFVVEQALRLPRPYLKRVPVNAAILGASLNFVLIFR